MSKTVLGVIMAVVAILAIGGIVIVAKDNDGKPTTTTSGHGGEGHTDQSGTQQSNIDTSADTSAQSSGQAVETVTVDIKDFAYTPATIKVKKGSTVTWTNQDSDRHDVAPDDESDAFKGSKLLSKGESYSFTFNTVGTYSYHCSPHPYMKATVQVVE